MKARLQGEYIFKNKSPIFFINYKQECFLGDMQLTREKSGHSENNNCDLLDVKHTISFICQMCFCKKISVKYSEKRQVIAADCNGSKLKC